MFNNPVSITVLHPITKDYHHYVFVGSVPPHIKKALSNIDATTNITSLKEYYGKNYKTKLLIDAKSYMGGARDDELSDLSIADLFNKDTPTKDDDSQQVHKTTHKQSSTINLTNTTTYIYDTYINQDDNLLEVRNKISLITDIPLYRQHLFWYEGTIPKQPYTLLINDLPHAIDIFQLASAKDKIDNIPIDKSISDYKSGITIKAYDRFILAKDIPAHLFIVDLDIFLEQSIIFLRNIRDKYTIDLLYYSFIIIYWPQLDNTTITDLFSSSHDAFASKYPNLVQDTSILRSIYNKELAIIKGLDLEAAKDIECPISITSVIIMVKTDMVSISLRKLFDLLDIASHNGFEIHEIHGHLKYQERLYFVRKQKQEHSIRFPSAINLTEAIVLAIYYDGRYLFLTIFSNGHYSITCSWKEENYVTFHNVLSLLKDPINSTIQYINQAKLSSYPLELLSSRTAIYKNINIGIYWKIVVTERVFRLILETFVRDYLAANIIHKYETNIEGNYFLFSKGTYKFDKNQLDLSLLSTSNIHLTNQYSYLSDVSIWTKWLQFYTGKKLKITHRTIDIKFEFFNLYEDEFDIIKKYIVGFLETCLADPTLAKEINKKEYTNVKKLKKIKEEDPVLFSIRKQGSVRGYSEICQKPRQPILYTEEEYSHLPPSVTKKLTKYKNMTTNKPIYYGCPSSEYPVLGFVGYDKHPQNFCMPCCNKLTGKSQDSKKIAIFSECMKNYKYVDPGGKHSNHIIKFGKTLPAGKLSYLHADMYQLMDYTYYVYGMNTPSILNVLCECLSMTTSTYLTGINAKLDIYFDKLLNGSLYEFFGNPSGLKQYFFALMNPGQLYFTKRLFENWVDLYLELTYLVYGVATYMFIYDKEIIKIYVIDIIKDQFATKNILITKIKNNYYPIFQLNIDSYRKTGEIETKVFTNQSFIKTFQQGIHYKKASTFDRYDLSDLILFASKDNRYKLTQLLINKSNLCYAVLVTFGGEHTFVTSVDYSSFTAQSSIVFEFDINCITASADIVRQFVSDYNQFTSTTKVSNDQPSPLKIDPDIYYSDGYQLGNGKLAWIADNKERNIYFIDASPTINRRYNNLTINNAILSRAPKKPHVNLNNIAIYLYENHLYLLFMLEFFHYIETVGTSKDGNLKQKIVALIKSQSNIGVEDIYHVIADEQQDKYGRKDSLEFYTDDIERISKLINKLHSGEISYEKLREMIDHTVFKFDRLMLYHLASLEPNEIIARLKTIAEAFSEVNSEDLLPVSAGEPANETANPTSEVREFPNIYTPCAIRDSFYCNNKKLKISSIEVRDDMISILAADLKNDLKMEYIMNYIKNNNIINFFNFKRKNTQIEIYAL